MFGKKKEEETIKVGDALYMIKNLIKCDVDECCMASMDKEDVIEKLEKIQKLLKEIDDKENPKDLHSALDGYYQEVMMGYNPFDYIGTDKRKRVSSKLMGLAQGVIDEHKLREKIKEILRKEND